MRFAFFHGDPITVLFIPGLVALVVGIAVIATTASRFRRSSTQKKLPAIYFALPYLIPVAVLLLLLAASSTGSGLSFISYGSSFLLTLPWSAVGHWLMRQLSNSGRVEDSVGVIVAGAGLNTMILYCVGIVAGVLKKRRSLVKKTSPEDAV
ncbi:MAG TPA: hypothetical protein VFX97_15200 [Pyrinomonadaceae bacterium]|nr:hypothetical protein [Pyrinomonadaceae bacterium]